MKRFNWRDWSKALKEIKAEATPLKLVLVANKLPPEKFWQNLSTKAVSVKLAEETAQTLKDADLAVFLGTVNELLANTTAALIKQVQTAGLNYLVVVNEALNQDVNVTVNKLAVALKTSENLIVFNSHIKSVKEKLIGLAGKKLVGLALVAPFLKDDISDKLITATARQNASLALTGVLPGSDMPFITANQIKLVLKLAAVYGERLSWGRALEMFFVTNSGFFFRYLARQLVDLLPVGGIFIKGSVAYAGTEAVGRLAKTYFKSLKETATTKKS